MGGWLLLEDPMDHAMERRGGGERARRRNEWFGVKPLAYIGWVSGMLGFLGRGFRFTDIGTGHF